MNLNQATIAGNLTRDPELRSLPSGSAVTSFSIATDRVWKGQDGEKNEATDYHNIVVFGKQAETVAQYLRKGSLALVMGKLQTRSWESDGIKHYRTEIVADTVQFGPSGGEASERAPRKAMEVATAPEYPEDEINPDDIPF